MTVSPTTGVTVEYVKTYLPGDGTNGEIAASYVIPASQAVTHTLTYAAGAHGSISGTSPQTVADGEDGTPVEAIADTGYHFVQWSDGSTANPRTDTAVTADVSVTADFEADAVFDTIDVTTPATQTSVAQGEPARGHLGAQRARGRAGPVRRLAGEQRRHLELRRALRRQRRRQLHAPASPPTCPWAPATGVYVYYRASASDAWSVGGLAAGTVDVTASTVFDTIDVTAPATADRVAQGEPLAVTWAPNVPVDAPAQFSVWLVSSGGIWNYGGLYDANGGASYRAQRRRRRARGHRLPASTSTTAPARATPGASAASPRARST